MANNFAEQYLKEKEKIEKGGGQQLKTTKIITVEELEKEIEKYRTNQGADFSNVDWEKVVADKDFTEDMVIMFQVQIQLYYDDYIKTHNVSDSLIRKMYYDFIGHFNPDMLDEKTKNRIFPELKESKE